MKKADTVMIERGPRVALRLMNQLGISSIYVVDKGNRLIGAVSAQDAVKAVEEDRPLQDVLVTNILKVTPDTVLTDLFDDVSTATIPVSVVDENDKLKGIIIRGALIGALAGNDRFINQNDLEMSDESSPELEVI